MILASGEPVVFCHQFGGMDLWHSMVMSVMHVTRAGLFEFQIIFSLSCRLPRCSSLQILHVSGLMESVTREQLRELFSQAGEVTKVDIPDGGRSMVSAVVVFDILSLQTL
jgi:hypothetical protein